MKRPNTTTVLLAVVAVLLGLNLWHGQATAQPNPQLSVPPRVVGIDVPITGNQMYRVWSDGLVEWRLFYWGVPPNFFDESPWTVVPDL